MSQRQVLWDQATEQYGFFTVAQARELGVTNVAVAMLARREQVERVAHGVYRFPQLPVTEYDGYMLAVLWTGVEGACLSHETALLLYDVCDINPTRVHVTVPRGRRVRRSGGEGYEVHHEDLDAAEVGWLHQIRATKFSVTMRQCTDIGVPAYLLTQALENGAARGLLLPEQTEMLRQRLEVRDT